MTTPPLPRTSLEPVCLALAEVVRQRRERAGLSLNQLAERTRLSRQMLSLVESGRRVPTIGVSEGAARVAVHRLRKRFREIYREEIARTLPAGADADAEMRHLANALARS